MVIKRSGIHTVRVFGIEMSAGYGFTVPLLLFFLVILYPLARVVFLALFDVSFLNPEMREFVGFGNFAAMLSAEARFLPAVGRSVLWVAGSVFLKVLIGLVLALLLNTGLRGRSFYRALSIIPWGIPWAIAAMMWGWTLNSQYGFINAILMQTGFLEGPFSFLTRPGVAFGSLMVVDAWIGIPFMVIILEAGLKSIPKQLYESAWVDGAGSVAQFFHITLPMLKKVLVTGTLLSTVWTFNSFDPIWILTGGGPLRTTETLPIAIYNTGFRMVAGGNLGLAAAMTVGQVILVSFIAVFYIRALKEDWRDA